MTTEKLPICQVRWLGVMDYDQAWALQNRLAAEIARGECPATLLLLEHPPVYTIGRRGGWDHLLWDAAECQRRGIQVREVDRGGDITYHGPGQLVGYPILSLKRVYAQQGLGLVQRYVTDLEEMVIRTLAEFGIAGQRFAGHRGVWVETPNGLDKIAAVGVRIQKDGITSHGFALNVNPDLTYFDNIIPCGIRDHGVASLAQLVARPVSVAQVLPSLIAAFADVFQVHTNVLAECLPA